MDYKPGQTVRIKWVTQSCGCFKPGDLGKIDKIDCGYYVVVRLDDGIYPKGDHFDGDWLEFVEEGKEG